LRDNVCGRRGVHDHWWLYLLDHDGMVCLLVLDWLLLLEYDGRRLLMNVYGRGCRLPVHWERRLLNVLRAVGINGVLTRI
jgi:hypothetical protein